MANRNDWEKSYYIDRDGHRIEYDPETMQPPIVYGDSPFTADDLNDEEAIYDTGTDPERFDGLPTHYEHGLYDPYPMGQPDYPPKPEINATPEFLDELAKEEGRFHIRYYGTVEHSMSLPHDPTNPEHQRGGLISLGIRDDNDRHLHTDVHTFNPLSLLNELNCPEGTRVRVDIQDWDNVIKDYIYNFPTQICPWEIDFDAERRQAATYVSLGQFDGNKKMALADFMDLIGLYYSTSLGTLTDTLKALIKDHAWIQNVPVHLGTELTPYDGVCLPYCHMPYPAIHGDFEFNPATRIGTMAFNYVCFIIKPKRDDPRIYEMRNPVIFKAGTVAGDVCPKQPMRLVGYAHVTIRDGSSEVKHESTDVVDLVIEPDGSVRIDGSLWFQHHKQGQPRVEENDRWRVEIASNGGVILL